MIRLDVQSRTFVDSSTLSVAQRLRLLLELQRFALPYWDKIMLRIVASLIGAAVAVVPPLLTARLIDVAFPSGDYGMVVQTAFLALGILLIGTAMGWLAGTDRGDQQPLPANVMSAYTLSRIALDMKILFYRHLQKLSMGFFSSRPVGEHMFRCTTDIDDAAFIASEVIPKVFTVVLRVILIVIVLSARFNPLVLVPAVFYLLCLFGVKHAMTTRVRYWDRQHREQYQRLEAVLREILYPFRLIKGYDLARTARRWYLSQARHMVVADYCRTLFVWSDFLITATMIPIYISVIVFPVAWLVLTQRLSVGEFTAIILPGAGLMAQLVAPFQEAIVTFQLIRQKLVPAERMLETLEIRPEVVDPPDRRTLQDCRGHVTVRNVWFSYTDGVPVLKDVSLEALPGKKTAIVGPSGAGKSTLCALLLRLYDPERGEVLMDGTPYRSVTQESLRSHMGIVMQSEPVFSESVEKNIRYGKPTAPADALARAASVARVDEFVSIMPKGYGTMLSESGSISGGQKQRLNIARALVREPSVLVLDEATSALDPVTEKEVADGIDTVFAGSTRIVVAHNVASARDADRIYVLDNGRIVAEGTHGELMSKNELYGRLWSDASREAAP